MFVINEIMKKTFGNTAKVIWVRKKDLMQSLTKNCVNYFKTKNEVRN